MQNLSRLWLVASSSPNQYQNELDRLSNSTLGIYFSSTQIKIPNICFKGHCILFWPDDRVSMTCGKVKHNNNCGNQCKIPHEEESVIRKTCPWQHAHYVMSQFYCHILRCVYEYSYTKNMPWMLTGPQPRGSVGIMCVKLRLLPLNRHEFCSIKNRMVRLFVAWNELIKIHDYLVTDNRHIMNLNLSNMADSCVASRAMHTSLTYPNWITENETKIYIYMYIFPVLAKKSTYK